MITWHLPYCIVVGLLAGPNAAEEKDPYLPWNLRLVGNVCGIQFVGGGQGSGLPLWMNESGALRDLNGYIVYDENLPALLKRLASNHDALSLHFDRQEEGSLETLLGVVGKLRKNAPENGGLRILVELQAYYRLDGKICGYVPLKK